MLTIRTEQMSIFSKRRQHAFERQLVELVRVHWPDVDDTHDVENILQMVRRAKLRAQSHGLTTAADVARYLNLSLLLGDSFDADPGLPWVRHFLDDVTMRPEARLQRLCAFASRHLAEEEVLHA